MVITTGSHGAALCALGAPGRDNGAGLRVDARHGQEGRNGGVSQPSAPGCETSARPRALVIGPALLALALVLALTMTGGGSCR